MADDAADRMDDETFRFLHFLMHRRNGISIVGLRSIGGRDPESDDAAIGKLVALGYVVAANPEQPIVTTDEGRRAWEAESRERERGA